MTCSNCGAVFDDTSRFCGVCGSPLEAPKKGTHRVPLLILLALTVLGIWVFFATGGTPATPAPEVSHDSSFTVTHGNLYSDSFFEGVTELTVPETVGGLNVTGIGRYCFSECDDLTVVYLPDTVTAIGESAFAGCDSLRAMELPKGVAEIGADAFADCPSLEAIRIPGSVVYMGPGVFDGCDSLSFIFYDGTIEAWKTLFDQQLSPETTVCCTDGTFHQPE